MKEMTPVEKARELRLIGEGIHNHALDHAITGGVEDRGEDHFSFMGNREWAEKASLSKVYDLAVERYIRVTAEETEFTEEQIRQAYGLASVGPGRG